MLTKRLGIDLGTANVLVYEVGRGIVLQEPSIVAMPIDGDEILTVGEEARAMYGRTPEIIEVIRPLRDGVIADYYVTERMLRYFIHKVCGPIRLFRPHVMISVPYGVTSVESRAVHEAAVAAGAHPGHVYLIPEPLAAALGAGLPVDTPTGNMIVDLGGGTTEAAVISMLGIVTAHSVRVGGIRMDEAIIGYMRRKYNMAIGEPTAEQVKIQIGTALPLDPPLTMEVQGRDLVTGLPRTITLTSDEVLEAIQEPLQAVVGVVRAVLERTPPELAADIIDRGMALVGGGAMLRRIDEFLTQQTGVPAYVADAPMACVAIGAGKALEHIHLFQRTLKAIWSSF